MIELRIPWLLFNVRDPDGTLSDVMQSAIREVIGSKKMDYVLTDGRAEIVSLVRDRMQERGAAMFRFVDANADGRVTFDELRPMGEAAFRGMDRNSDGALSRDEVRRRGPEGRRGPPAGAPAQPAAPAQPSR